MTAQSTSPSRDELIEELAAIEHERWAHWQAYLHQQCQRNPDGSLTIPADLVSRWSMQMATPYAELSDAEKQSDREQVVRYLPIVEMFFGTPPARP